MTARDDGYNPMRHECATGGCYIKECRPKSEWFCGLFPGKSSFSDLDRIVEHKGRGLVFEWKSAVMDISLGQKIMWERLTKGKLLTVFCAAGDVKEMAIIGYAVFFDGKFKPWQECGLIDFTEAISKWVKWAEANSLLGPFNGD